MWRDWTKYARPIDRIVDHYKWSKAPFETWVGAQTVGLDSRTDLQTKLKRALLEATNLATTCSVEREQAVLEWTDEVFSFAEREAWFVTYLSETYRSRWSTQSVLLAAIIKRYGAPGGGRPFWDLVSNDVRRAVETWVKDRELTARLGEGEHGERVEFWRRFLSLSKQLLVSRCETAVFICFDGWFAVQFVHTGHATYFFESSYLTLMRRRERNGLYSTVLGTPSLAKYEHRGHFWAANAEAVVNAVMRRHTRS
jgi:hypothetical protein